MDINKNDGNMSLNEFDDTAFDDMTFEDELPQGNTQSNIPNTNQQPMQNMQRMQAAQSTDTNNKKAKPAKKQKQPKQKKVKTANTGEQQKKSKAKLLLVIPIIVIAVVGLLLVLKLNAPKNADKHVTLAVNKGVSNNTSGNNEGTQVADNTATNSTDTNTTVSDNTEENSNNTDENSTSTESPDKNDPAAEDNSEENIVALNEPGKMKVIVNTKLEGETEYTDHEAFLEFEYSNFVAGYDNVKTYLDEYNATATNKINLPKKDKFYKSSVGNDLVMYEITISVPEDFPTNDVKHGFTGISPECKLEITGTEKEDTLITKLYEFKIPTVYYIGNDITSFTIGSTYKLRYMTTMPMELTADDYKLSFTFIDNKEGKQYRLQSMDIPENEDAVKITKKAKK